MSFPPASRARQRIVALMGGGRLAPGGPGAVLLAALLLVGGCSASADINLGRAEVVADGIYLYRVSDTNLLTPPGPVAVQLLRLDPRRVELRSAIALDEVMGSTETVPAMARRHGAVAAINAGFFSASGNPAGLLKVGGELVSDTRRSRGAVGIHSDGTDGRPRLLFDRVSVTMRLSYEAEGTRHTIPISGINTTRVRGGLMLFTPRYHADTDTASTGTEWVLQGDPLTVVDRRDQAGKTLIPHDGVVLSYGGSPPTPALNALEVGRTVRLAPVFTTSFGTSPEDWAAASEIVGGAGLLMIDGRVVEDWAPETFRAGFAEERHPRTIVGVDREQQIWLITVDGRHPEISLGMNFQELQHLARRLRLRNALNLDGGGSTTMVVRDRVINRPSDPTGPRPVSDALLVFARGELDKSVETADDDAGR
jgi:hypothetical protein